jgi:hypothetical protein
VHGTRVYFIRVGPKRPCLGEVPQHQKKYIYTQLLLHREARNAATNHISLPKMKKSKQMTRKLSRFKLSKGT